MKPETKFYAQVKRNFTEIQWKFLMPASRFKVPKLYEGSCIRDLVARGLKLEPKESGFKDIEKFLSLLGA
jgi:hypothetical protein